LEIPVPVVSLLYCQSITPPNHPNYWKAFVVQVPRSDKLTSPVFITSNWAAGCPTIILLEGIPLPIIYFTEVLLKVPVECINNSS
jgi:hypothetical protein